MDDRKIEVLLAAIRVGSFSKAAEELHCTQSAVTQTINALEKELHCKVLNRSHCGISLSSVGEALLPAILETEKSLRKLKEQAKTLSQGTSLPIRIGAFSSISNTWLPKRLLEYQKSHPDVIFDIRIGTDNLSDWLLTGEIDLALGDQKRLQKFP
jgi:DNA-binding transcriptional LysR family regulator